MPQATTDDDYPTRIRAAARTAGFDDAIADLAVQAFDHAIDANVVTEMTERDDAGKFASDDVRFPPAAIGAAVYSAARVRNVPTKPGELADVVGADGDRVARYYRRILDTLPYSVEPESPVAWVDRLCDDLGVGADFNSDASELARAAVDAGLHVGKSTSGFAAAVVYATSKHRNAGIEQDTIADVASVSPTTIRNQYRDVLALRDESVVPGDPDAIAAAVHDICDRVRKFPDRVRTEALDLAADAANADAEWVRRTDPKGVAAGVVYVVAKDCRLDVTQTEVATAAGVSKSTVVNRVYDIRDWRRRRRFDGVNYNDLKRLAAEHGVDAGTTPDREYLVDRLVEAGVEYDG